MTMEIEIAMTPIKPKNSKDYQQAPGARRGKEDSLIKVSEGAWPCWQLDFRLLES